MLKLKSQRIGQFCVYFEIFICCIFIQFARFAVKIVVLFRFAVILCELSFVYIYLIILYLFSFERSTSRWNRTERNTHIDQLNSDRFCSLMDINFSFYQFPIHTFSVTITFNSQFSLWMFTSNVQLHWDSQIMMCSACFLVD